jgi:hypothetical protein
MHCQQCGKEFQASKPAVYCSGACRVAAHRARNRPAVTDDAEVLRAENAELKAIIAPLEPLLDYLGARLGRNVSWEAIEKLNRRAAVVWTSTPDDASGRIIIAPERLIRRFARRGP